MAVLLTLLVVAATDAGGSWPSRLGMTAALAPLCGAVGTLAAVRVAAARGELRALAALGAEPGRVVLGALAGGSALGLLGPLVAASGLADLDGLFPRPPAARLWTIEGVGLHEVTLGLHVGAHGDLALGAPSVVASALAAGTTGFTLAALAAAAIAAPAWLSVARASPARRAAVGAAAVALAIAAFQGVAAGRVPPVALVLGPAVLALDGFYARRRP